MLQKKGWRAGLVATSEISHATPASFAAHVDSRNKQQEIAEQLVANRLDVLLGGGQKYFGPELSAEAAAHGYQMLTTRDQMLALRSGPAIGLFADGGLTTSPPEPSLAEISAVAVKLLSSPKPEWFAPKPKFFLMIEGSQIDWAAHANDTDRVIRQTLLFDMAVCQAVEFAQKDKHTLVIVTADHETGGLILSNKGGIGAHWTGGSHTAGDVPIFAFGPGSQRFSAVMDNTDISKRIAELTGIKEFPVRKTEALLPEPVSAK